MTNATQDLAKVKERISALNSELGELYNEQKQLEQEIAKRKREIDMPVREKLIDEWVEQQPSKFDITINFSEYNKDYDIHVKRGDYGFAFSELFFVRKSMSDSEVKCYLAEITENLNLIDELVNQNVYNEQFGDEIFADKLTIRSHFKTGKLYSYIYMDEPYESEDSQLDIRLNKIGDNSVQAHVIYEVCEVYDKPNCKVQLNDTTEFVIERSPFTLTHKQTISFDNMVSDIKKLVDNFENMKAEHIKYLN